MNTQTFTSTTKLSTLLEMGINDLQAQQKTRTFTFSPSHWLENVGGCRCVGCLAGAVLRQRNLAPAGVPLNTIDAETRIACKRLNAARMGGISPMEIGNTNVAYECLEPIRKTYDASIGLAPSKYIRQSIRRLKRNGL